MMVDTDVCKQNNEGKTDWPTDNFKGLKNDRDTNHVIRKFINSAIYVEKSIADIVSVEEALVSQKYSADDLINVQFTKTKRCACSVDQKTCPCHGTSFSDTVLSEPRKTVAVCKTSEQSIKISRPSTTASGGVERNAREIKKWLMKKDEEKRKKEKEKVSEEAKMKERQAVLEQERDNFKKWLMNKKKQEMEAKKKKQKEVEERQLKDLEKEKKHLESQLNFQLWLKKKEEETLEKKIKQQMELITDLEKKEKQLRENEKAFNEWLKSSKNKQKPIPLNKGIQSLCSSTSITYINPNPWNSTT